MLTDIPRPMTIRATFAGRPRLVDSNSKVRALRLSLVAGPQSWYVCTIIINYYYSTEPKQATFLCI